jgi:hypothetical protein
MLDEKMFRIYATMLHIVRFHDFFFFLSMRRDQSTRYEIRAEKYGGTFYLVLSKVAISPHKGGKKVHLRKAYRTLVAKLNGIKNGM